MKAKIPNQQLDYLHLGGWCLVAEMIRKNITPLEDIAKVARLWADSWHGDMWPVVKKCREGFNGEPELLVKFLDVLSLAGLNHLATTYINSRPDFMSQFASTESQHQSEQIKRGIRAARERRRIAADVSGAGSGSE